MDKQALHKAIKKENVASLSSVFKGKYIYDASMMELIASAMGHVKRANQKKSENHQDYWTNTEQWA